MSTSKKLIVSIILIFALTTLGLTGCKTLVQSPIIGVSTSDTIGMTGKIVDDLTKMAGEDGYSLTSYDAQGSYETQDLQIGALIESGVNVLAVCPSSQTEISASLQAAADAEIPVVVFERPLTDSNVSFVAGYDAAGEAKTAAEAIAKNDNGKMNVVVEIVGPSDNPNAVAASKAFHEVIDLVDNIEVVAIDSNWNPKVAKQGILSVLMRYPNITAIYNSNSTLDYAISEALDEYGLNSKSDVSGHIYRVSVSGSKNGYLSTMDGHVDLLVVTAVDDLSSAVYDALVTLGNGKTLESTSFTAPFSALAQDEVQANQGSIWGFVSGIE